MFYSFKVYVAHNSQVKILTIKTFSESERFREQSWAGMMQFHQVSMIIRCTNFIGYYFGCPGSIAHVLLLIFVILVSSLSIYPSIYLSTYLSIFLSLSSHFPSSPPYFIEKALKLKKTYLGIVPNCIIFQFWSTFNASLLSEEK